METNTRIQKLTTSQVKCFKTCRKRYFLEYVEMLKPVETPRALEIGTLYHKGLEVLLKSGSIELAISELHKAVRYDMDPYQDEITYLTVKQMVLAFNRSSGWRDWHIVSIERPFEVSTGYAKRLLGKIDGIVKKTEGDNLGNYLIEHKTTSQWGTDGSTYLHNLLWDEQSTNYLYAHSKMLEDGSLTGESVKGVFYVIVEKPTIKPYKATPFDQRKYTKDGALYKNQHETDESPADFECRLAEWYLSECRVHTTFVYRTPEDIKEHIHDYNMVLRDIAACEREGTYYRNPEACKILPCPYRPKCLDNVPDTDCLFVRKAARNEELLTEPPTAVDNTEIDPHNGKAYTK